MQENMEDLVRDMQALIKEHRELKITYEEVKRVINFNADLLHIFILVLIANVIISVISFSVIVTL